MSLDWGFRRAWQVFIIMLRDVDQKCTTWSWKSGGWPEQEFIFYWGNRSQEMGQPLSRKLWGLDVTGWQLTGREKTDETWKRQKGAKGGEQGFGPPFLWPWGPRILPTFEPQCLFSEGHNFLLDGTGNEDHCFGGYPRFCVGVCLLGIMLPETGTR